MSHILNLLLLFSLFILSCVVMCLPFRVLILNRHDVAPYLVILWFMLYCTSFNL